MASKQTDIKFVLRKRWKNFLFADGEIRLGTQDLTWIIFSLNPFNV